MGYDDDRRYRWTNLLSSDGDRCQRCVAAEGLAHFRRMATNSAGRK